MHRPSELHVDNYAWVDKELGWPVHAGVINGVGQGKFNPGGDLTTEQVKSLCVPAYIIIYMCTQGV